MESIIESSKPPPLIIPRKLSLSSSFSFPIRAPLTLDDDDSGSDFERNDNEFVNTNSSKTKSERPFVAAHSYDNKSLESGGGCSDGDETENPKWVRPIAKLNWDDDDDGSSYGSDFVGSEIEYREKEDISFGSNIGVVEKISIAPRIKVEEKGDEIESLVDENGLMGLEEGKKLEDFTVVGVVEDFNDLELLKGEKGVVEGEFVVCQSRNDNSLSLEVGDMPEREVSSDMGFGHAKDGSVADAVEFGGDELDWRRFSVSNEAEETAVDDVEFGGNELDSRRFSVSKQAEETAVDAVEFDGVELDPRRFSVSTAVDAVEFGGDVLASRRYSVSKQAEETAVDAVQFGGDELDSRRFSVSKQAEETAEMGKCDFSEVIEVDGYENALYSDSSLDRSEKPVGDVEEACDEEGIEEDVEITKQPTSEIDVDIDGEGQDSFGSATVMALLDAATSVNGSGVITVDDPLRELAPQQTLTPSELKVEDESEDNLSADEKKKFEKMRLLRVNFLRLVHRLGISLEDSAVNGVFDELVLASGEHGHSSALKSAKRMALDLESEKKETDLDLCLNILVLGKSGVGKSATINFIFGEKKAAIHAFEPATTSLTEIVGKIDGVKIKILDTPGLKVPAVEQAANQKMLASVSKFMKKSPPDVILYVDRLDTEANGDNDLPMLKSITKSLGSSIWQKAIVILTHSAVSPPDGPSGLPLSHDTFVAQKSRAVLQSISMAVGNNMRSLNPNFKCPVSLVENSPMFSSQDSVWRSQLLLLFYSRKVLSKASSLSLPANSSNWRRVLGLPVSHLLPSLFQSHPHPNFGDSAHSYNEFRDLCDSESEEDEDDYDKLPSFRPLRKSQNDKLNKEQGKAYFKEYDYRVKLFVREQWREAAKRLREIKNKGKGVVDVGHDTGDEEEEKFNLVSESLRPSIDGDGHAYRYRCSVPAAKLLVGPIIESTCWDHECGWDGVSLERDFALTGRLPGSFQVQITKDKNDLNVHLDSSMSLKHNGERGSTLARLDVETFGNRLTNILRGETEVRNFKINKTTAGVTVTFLGENVATGLKIEDQIAVGRHLVLAAGARAVQSNSDTAYGANFEVRIKDKDFPIGQEEHSSLGLCLTKWRSNLALTAVVTSRFAVGRGSKMAVHFGLNNEGRGRISVRTSGSDQLHIALASILPILVSIIGSIFS